MIKYSSMKLSRLFIAFLLLIAPLFFGVQLAHAQGAATELDPSQVFGTVEAPPGVEQYNNDVGENGIGIILFASNMIKIVTIIAGLIVFLNLIIAGFNYITADGESAALKKVQDSVKNSVIGLFLIVISYTITAIISLAFFGDPGFILNPQISGPSSAAPAAP